MTGRLRGPAAWAGPAVAAALAAPFIPLFRLHPDGAFDLLTLLLAVGAGVRVGRAAAERTPTAAAIAGAVILVALAFLGMTWSPHWLAGGLVLLAAWSGAGSRRAGAAAPVPFAAAWSLLSAVLLLALG